MNPQPISFPELNRSQRKGIVLDPITILVRSESSDSWYPVTLDEHGVPSSCGCPDFVYRLQRACKHMLWVVEIQARGESHVH